MMDTLSTFVHRYQLTPPVPSALLYAQMMTQAQGQHRDLIQTIEGLPPAAGPLSPLNQDLLMLKATSMATMNCLNDCLHILQLQQVARQRSSLGGEGDRWGPGGEGE